jgi:hypothetical protein
VRPALIVGAAITAFDERVQRRQVSGHRRADGRIGGCSRHGNGVATVLLPGQGVDSRLSNPTDVP